jgi:hypothetical protein
MEGGSTREDKYCLLTGNKSKKEQTYSHKSFFIMVLIALPS